MIETIFGVMSQDYNIQYFMQSKNGFETIKLTDLDQQASYLLLLLIPSQWVVTHCLSLPKVSQQKQIQVAGYAMEDKLLYDVQDYHLAMIDNKDQSTVIATLEKSRLHKIIRLIPSFMLLQQLTSASLLLNENQAVTTGQEIIANIKNHSLVMPKEFFEKYTEGHAVQMIEPYASTESYFFPMLLNNKNNNLLTGKYKPKKIKLAKSKKQHYLIPGVMAVLAIYLLSSIFEIGYLAHKNHRLENQIEQSYYQLFPQAKSIVAPEIRVKQLLSGEGDSAKASQFLTITQIVSNALANNQKIYLDSLKYQNKQLLVNISADDFSIVDQFKQQLTNRGLIVKQRSGNTDADHVNASLLLENH